MNRQPTTPSGRPGGAIYAGLFLITLSTLLLELGLTRLFSVLIYYHMAFFAVSVTLFGLAFGGVIVHFFPGVFHPDRAGRWMSRMSMAFALTTVAALAVMLAIRYDMANNRVIVGQLILVSLALAVPFTCSGVAVALALTRFPRQTNRLYCADLAGASLGCLLFAPLIARLGGPGFIVGVAVITALAAVVLVLGDARGPGGSARLAGALAVMAVAGLLLAFSGNLRFLQIHFLRGYSHDPRQMAFQGWNSISRVTVYPDTGHAMGVAPENYEKSAGPQFTILIDTFAAVAEAGRAVDEHAGRID
ncbi:MAG: hypothetical protein M1457_07100, partial [bacterium]|nr:hypothetical protein [bacterium]